MSNEEKHKIKCKAILGLPLTPREKSYYLLFIANDKEAKEFIQRRN